LKVHQEMTSDNQRLDENPMKRLRVAVIGGGPECLAIMDMVSGEIFQQGGISLVGIADANLASEAVRRARTMNIFTTRDYRELLRIRDLDLIIEVTGDPEITQDVERLKPTRVKLVDHPFARLFWELARDFGEKKAETWIKEAVERLELDLERSQEGYQDISIKKKLEESRKIYSERLEGEIQKRTEELWASEREIRRQKKTAEGILSGSPIPMMVIDRNHKIIYWNRACEKLTGYRSDEMIGTDRQWEPFYVERGPVLADLVIENDTEAIERNYRNMNIRKSSLVEGAYEAEHFFPHLGAGGIHLYTNVAPIKDDLGMIQGAIVTYQDFSERVKLTQESKRREAFVQNLVQNSIDGIIATERTGKIIIFNRGAAGILGYSPEEAIGRMRYQGILSEEMARTIREAFYGTKYGPPGKIINMEAELLSKAKEPIPVRLSGTLLFEEGDEVGSVVFIQDLREIHRLQAEKEQALRMAAIGRAVAGLAHYIKNILTGLKGGAYVIRSAVAKGDLPLVQKGWDMVERNIDQVGNIVTDMLIYSKDREPRYELVNPNELVMDVLTLMEDRAKLAGVTLVHELRADLSKVAMDRTAIHRCLLNLVSNAIDACTLEGIINGKGIVTVKTDRADGWGIRFQVVDNGTGMDDDIQRKLFTDFFSTKGYKGTGLGLPVTQKIVQEHGGKVDVRSQPGEGSTFSLFLR
jgi:PAS domain S-box-containing protein